MKLNLIDVTVTFITYHGQKMTFYIMVEHFDRLPNSKWLDNWRVQTEEYLSHINCDNVTLHIAHIKATDRESGIESEMYGTFERLAHVIKDELENLF